MHTMMSPDIGRAGQKIFDIATTVHAVRISVVLLLKLE
jgi:hypothetical protein